MPNEHMSTKNLHALALGMLFTVTAQAQNCAWGNCTPQQVQQEYQQNQLRQLQGINNSLNQIQQQQQVAPALGQWSNTPQPILPQQQQQQQLAPAFGQWPNTQQRQQNCYKDAYGRVFCQ
jgi:hypothetical protein